MNTSTNNAARSTNGLKSHPYPASTCPKGSQQPFPLADLAPCLADLKRQLDLRQSMP